MSRPERLRDVDPAALPVGFSADDLVFCQWLREDSGAMHRIESHGTDLGTAKGAIFAPCSDGERICDLFDHFRVFLTPHKNGNPIPHTVAQAGVALRFDAASPVLARLPGNEQDHNVYLNEIEVGIKAKGLNFVALCTHWPCGAALMSNVTLTESLKHLCRSKQAIERRFRLTYPDLKIALFLDLDVGTRQFTYFLRRDDLIKALAVWHINQSAVS